MLKSGTIIDGPNGMAYRLTVDLNVGDIITTGTFEPIGGAPVPKPNQPIEPFLRAFIERNGGITP